uniref:Acyltransferase n=1 Tax=candidate division WOR-3 bacterium TaxID=2052148 RepID=A0A7C3N7L2_UNCW3
MNFIIVNLGKIFYLVKRFSNYCLKNYQKGKFKGIGKNVYIGDYCHFTEKNIIIGDNVYIGRNCIFQSTHGLIKIGNNVMIGPGCHIHGGNHEFKKIGYYINEITKNNNCWDGEIVIEEDCWIGANTIILKGAKIGKGSVIGAGSIINREVPPYSLYVGSPPMNIKIKKRFSEEEIKEHENILLMRKNEKETNYFNNF